MADAPAPDAFFLPRDGGQRLCIFHAPQAVPARGALVYVHPFAEEMNKSRRMAARQSRALAEAGYAVLQIDLLGCGDSSGDFGDATWQAWLDDVLAAAAWLRARVDAPLWLWGLRAGCLLAAEAASRIAQPCNLLFCQPGTAGKQVLQQFLRLAAAGSLADGNAKAVLDGLRQRLADGESIEVAGYTLSAALAQGLEAATLASQAMPARLEWLELSSRADATLSPASERALAAWRAQGWRARHQLVAGPAFWQTVEIEDAPDLPGATTAALADDGANA